MIEVHNLTFGYSATEDGQILKGVDFAAKTGKLTALIGTNGAGKSTLLKTIMGILKGKGEISVNGKPVSQYSTKDFSSTVSYLSQDNDCKVNLSVFEVVMLGRMGSMSFRVSDEDIAATQEVLERLNLQRFASRSIMELSGGQRQLVFMAQALVKENDFTTLVTLHHLDLAAMFADEIIVLKEGTVYAQGAPKDIFTEAMMEDVYRVKTKIYMDDNGLPHVIPLEAIIN